MRTTDDRVWVSTVVYSIEGQPTLDLAVGTEREISARGRRALGVASLTVLLSGLVITLVLIFLLIATILGYFAYQNVWATAKRKVAPKGALDPEHQSLRERAKDNAGIEG